MLKKLLKKHPDIVAVTVFFLFSLTLLLPQILTKAVVTGDDIVFHYNRFYDTAMQIKSGDFSYIMSLHGYQQSGRIVNALYGPYLAYLQGALLLLAGTWYRYQLLSNLLLGVFSATSLYFLMREVKVRYSLSVGLSMFFVTTYSVQYWWVAQGFSSWGVALFPLCLIPAVRFLKTGKVPIFLMAGAVGLMLQIHMLSALFLILAYAILFSIGWLKSQDKWNVMKDVLFSVGVFLILTVNIWFPLLNINATNELAAPFINKKFIQSTVTWSFSYFLYFPFSLPIIFATSIYFMIKKWKKQSMILKSLTITFLVFFIFSTNLFPWQLFAGKGIGLVDLIQFPFRFFLYANTLLLTIVGLQLTDYEVRKKLFLGMTILSTIIGVGFTWDQYKQAVNDQYNKAEFLQDMLHTTLYGTTEELRASLHSKNLGEFVQLAQKSTPDYVPVLSEKEENVRAVNEAKSRYDRYRDQIILPNQQFNKQVFGDSLKISWSANQSEEIQIPIVIYRDSELTLNGKRLGKTDYYLSTIGVPMVASQKGKNTLILSYKQQWWLLPVIFISLTGWILWSIYYTFIYRKSNIS
ncbi:hypothetical protein HO944_06815 [Streptococcus suis]|uniref:Major facilitator superfamily permease n=1 Tax=Streptococcus suis TaxID=1307 RepID=A0A116LZ15_STRSU|nr:membrane protein [Streptococcus suis]NQH52608.1 hypothetical protein [Streptococcus suis]NQO80661.1 hypothetical protein [Streptococcus suis]NQO89261.1 hypothetical protein [Streptococcus suis]NQP68056.1 hypothetical protein [Streptococcus suis]CYV18889.1 major facilitator superfamily permease [Streptococcus suis]